MKRIPFTDWRLWLLLTACTLAVMWANWFMVAYA